MKTCVFFILILFPIGGSCNDYSVTGSSTQSMPVEHYRTIIINCYCPNGVEIVKHDNNNIIMEISGEESSVGYHGDQSAPVEIKPESLKFKINKLENKMILSSQEWTYIHHAFFIHKLIVKKPESVKVRWIKIEHSELEGRGN